MGQGRGRPGGNPDFGTKYKAETLRGKPLLDQVGTKVDPEIKLRLKEVAKQKNCSVPELVRAAIEQYLASIQPESAA